MLTSDPPMTIIATPSRISSPPRVTMNDGIFSRATSDPWMAPPAEQASNAAMVAAHHGQFAPPGCTSSATTTAPSAMTRPTDRSISPRSRAKISAIASTMYTVLCSKRLTRFSADRNCEFATWKLTATTTMARTTGRTPLLPLRTWGRRIGAVLTEEKGTEQYAAQAGGRGAQRERPGADGGEADAGAAGRFGVATDGIDVAAEAGPLEQERPGAKDDEDDRDHPRNPLHPHEGGSAVDSADHQHSYPDHRHQGDSDCCQANRGSHQALASPRGRA